MRPVIILLAVGGCLYVPPDAVQALLDPDDDGVPYPEDCRPDDEDVFPGADERCKDDRDNDCDGSPGACAIQDAQDAWLRVDAESGAYGTTVVSNRFTGERSHDVLAGSGASASGGVVLVTDYAPGQRSLSESSLDERVRNEVLTLFDVGDLNEDGFDDVLLGAPESSDAAGGSYAVLTGPSLDYDPAETGESWSLSGARAGATAAAGGVLAEENPIPTMLLGAPGYESVLLKGWSGAIEGESFVRGQLRWWRGVDDDAGFAESVAGGGDVDGDGHDDAWVGAPGTETDAGDDAGAVWLVRGPVAGDSDRSWIDDVGVRIDGSEADAGFGAALLGAVDLDGDGYSDLVATAPFADAGGDRRGQVHVLLGGAGDVPAADRIVIRGGQDRAGEGLVLAVIEDFWGVGTGLALAVGQPLADSTLQDVGIVWAFDGLPADGTSLSDAPFQIVGDEADMRLGAALASAGDALGDGWPDVVIGAPGANDGGGALLFADVGY